MQSVGEILRGLDKSTAGKRFYDMLQVAQRATPEDRRNAEQAAVERYNAASGELAQQDGYDCPLCNNRGNTAELLERNGMLYQVYRPCRCIEIRKSIARMRNSGLANSISQCTFKAFHADAPWQKVMLDTAQGYAAEGLSAGRWLFFGGAVGSGKTHLCTAICREALRKMPILYMSWPADAGRIKSNVGDEAEYQRQILPLKNIKFLYIDDFLKPTAGRDGNTAPSAADIRLAYEILNHRYINHMPTIISSERYLSELMEIDEATASRIAECAKGYCKTISRGNGKNYRLRNDEVL